MTAATKLTSAPKLTAAQEAVLAKARTAKAHRLSPLPLRGAEKRTGRSLVELGLLASSSSGFYIPTTDEAAANDRPEPNRQWTVDGCHLIDPDGYEQLDQPGREKFLRKIAAGLNLLDKLPRTP